MNSSRRLVVYLSLLCAIGWSGAAEARVSVRASVGGYTETRISPISDYAIVSKNVDDPTFRGEGTAISYADTATGKLGGYATANFGFDVGASQWIEETLYFTISDADAETITPVVFNFSHHGILELIPDASNAQAASMLQVSVSMASGGGATYTHGVGTGQLVPLEQYSGWSSVHLVGDHYDRKGAFAFNLKGANPTLNLFMNLGVSARRGTADFLNTATVGMELPDGVTYTSSSGAFLRDVGVVPEPATWALMILGFGGAGVMLRRRRTPSLAGF